MSERDEIECDHTNAHTTFKNAELWQGVCDDCGADLEDVVDEVSTEIPCEVNLDASLWYTIG